MKELSPERALEILRGMDSGEIKFTFAKSKHPCEVCYYGYPRIGVTVFDDGGEWDYIDQVQEGDLVWNPDKPLNSEHRDIFFWEPTNWKRWVNPDWDDTDHSGPKGFPSNAAL